ncbi:dipeptide ABC transporter ATP-binding protein [Acidimangrovimonas sediminis]|uniref:dipeptide ABC transporter ATP-binding protein n=1 Tax=Acidimangrovimonas sediminis TaxID=2056283 RepID=UPI001304D7A6|nr:ABC transporter ATP-binding protein [Acidimangrovimonas sediminis]
MPSSATEELLRVDALSVGFAGREGPVPILREVGLSVGRGEIVCLVGESGSGKSMTALSIAGLLPPGAQRTAGRITLGGTALAGQGPDAFDTARGKRIGVIFQEPMTALNPVLKVSEQISESLVRHSGMGWAEARRETIRLLGEVGIADAPRRADQFVHQLSGGMRQRVMIATAIAANPEFLIADEPTTALDSTVQAQVLDLIRGLRDSRGMGVLFITHDLGVVAEIADRVCVMYAGRVVEEGPVREVLQNPRMPYTRGLLAALPREDGRVARLQAIPGNVPAPRDMPPGCSFAPRCAAATEVCAAALPALEEVAPGHSVRCLRWQALPDQAARPDLVPDPEHAERPAILKVRDLVKHYPVRTAFGARHGQKVRAVDGVSFDLARGEVLALVGESGSGKTTLGRCLMQLVPPTSGSVTFEGTELIGLPEKRLFDLRRRLQIVFQDPFASLDPKMTIGQILAEPLRLHAIVPKDQVAERVARLLDTVGLPATAAARRPADFSGGQRQRIAIARALALEPEVIVADEAVSALDVSIRAQVVGLLQDLRADLGLSMVFITHDLALVRQIADRVLILYLGQVMEEGPAAEVFRQPRHPYTRALLSAIPVPDPDRRRERIVLGGDIPSPINPPSGCVFRTRCPRATAECARDVPAMRGFGPGHAAACLHPLGDGDA